jgi:hypothetical protein
MGVETEKSRFKMKPLIATPPMMRICSRKGQRNLPKIYHFSRPITVWCEHAGDHGSKSRKFEHSIWAYA